MTSDFGGHALWLCPPYITVCDEEIALKQEIEYPQESEEQQEQEQEQAAQTIKKDNEKKSIFGFRLENITKFFTGFKK